MTPRERVLAIGVGGVLALVGCQYLFSTYRSAVQRRTTRINALTSQLEAARDKELQGALADRQMGEYMVRSLPSNPQEARPQYTRWLYELMGIVNLEDGTTSFVNSMPVGDLYERYGFKMSGKTDARGWIELLHAFYSKDYLHRISEMNVRPAREGGLAIDLTIDVIALKAAAPDLKPPAWNSAIVGNFESYAGPILNRNAFSGPNKAPSFSTDEQLATELGRPASLRIEASDQDNDRVRYELVGDVPAGLSIDDSSGRIRWEPSEKGEFRVRVRAVDNGYPPKSTEREFKIAVNDPPPPPAPAQETPKFDDSTQTVLTALVQGGGDWTAWMKVRTRGTTLKLKPGDQFEIGALKGSVVEVNSRYVVLEIDGRKFELRPAGILADAAKSAEATDAGGDTDAAEATSATESKDVVPETNSPAAAERTTDQPPSALDEVK